MPKPTPLYLLPLVLFAVLLPQIGLAGDNSCLDQVRADLIKNPPQIPTSLLALTGSSGADLINATRQKEEFTRDSESSKFEPIYKLGYQYSLANTLWRLNIEYTLSATEKSSTEALFDFEEDYALTDQSGNPKADVSITYVYTTNCQRIVGNQTNIIYTQEGDKTRITTLSKNAGAAVQKTEVLQASEVVKNTVMLSKINSLQDAKKAGILSGKSIPFVDVAGQTFFLKLSALPNQQNFNPILKKTQVFENVQIQFYDASHRPYLLITSHGPADDSYSFQKTLYVGESSVEEDITSSKWLTELLSPSDSENAPILKGFKSEAFSTRALDFSISSKKHLSFYENASEYFVVQPVRRSSKLNISAVHSFNHSKPKIIDPWDKPTNKVDNVYLSSTRYIHPDAVANIADELRPALKELNRLQAAVLIIKKIDALIPYDDKALKTGIIAVETTEDILNNKTGVCQHYAGLFVAVARELGIPARIVEGYYLDATGAGAHAWVEVKLNDKTWWPLEPQIASDSLPSRSYFPLTVMWEYEVPADRTKLEFTYKTRDAVPMFNLNRSVFQFRSYETK